MATDSHNTARLSEAIELPNELPTFIRELGLGELASDARHLSHLIKGALDNLVSLQVIDADMRQDLERGCAFLWVARDLAELLDWKLDRLDDTQERQRRRQ